MMNSFLMFIMLMLDMTNTMSFLLLWCIIVTLAMIFRQLEIPADFPQAYMCLTYASNHKNIGTNGQDYSLSQKQTKCIAKQHLFN